MCFLSLKKKRKPNESFFFQLIKDAETISKRLEHRGARAGDNNTGDGAGIMTSIPYEFYKECLK